MDKKSLIDPVFDMDPNNPYPEDCLEKVNTENRTEVRNNTGSYRKCLFVFGVIGSAIFVGSFIALYMRRQSNAEDFVKFRTSFKGQGGRVIEEEVISSGMRNFIEYTITSSPNERLTIVEDFNKGIQVVKISSFSEDYCYISELKRGSYIRPSDFVLDSQVEKSYVSQVFETFDRQIDDDSQLGERGAELCRGLPVDWIRPVSDTESQISQANFTESSYVPQSGSRSKRGIRGCFSSCCHYICCCSVHHFTWERAEHFSCNHVCKKCTTKSKNIIAKIC